MDEGHLLQIRNFKPSEIEELRMRAKRATRKLKWIRVSNSWAGKKIPHPKNPARTSSNRPTCH